MAAFSEANDEAILTACRANASALAEALSQCFDQSYCIEAGDAGVWPPAGLPAPLSGPGLVALVQVSGQGLAVLVPDSLPLPNWHLDPDDSQKSRLETLAMEWSMNLLPAGFEPERFQATAVENLGAAIKAMAPADGAATCELHVFEAGQPSDKHHAKLLVVWPLDQPNADDQRAAEPTDSRQTQQSAPPVPKIDPFGRLRHLPITVSVRLAEKKISMSQLLGITPGMLITFNKSCEDLLELYVNNARYCRGEAVKIGENFGLKINQVGVKEDTPHKVIEG